MLYVKKSLLHFKLKESAPCHNLTQMYVFSLHTKLSHSSLQKKSGGYHSIKTETIKLPLLAKMYTNVVADNQH